MPSRRETVSFTAHDGSGNRVVIVAERGTAFVAGTNRKPPWTFRTTDGRIVRRTDGIPGCYTIDPDGIPLTTDDPNEPKDT
jgi:hypothetical protein